MADAPGSSTEENDELPPDYGFYLGADNTQWNQWGHLNTPNWTSSFSRTLYVDAQNGSDSHDGLSAPQAFKTIQYASTQAQPGDRILIADGIYRETITPVQSGTSQHPIVLEGQSVSNTIITGSDRIVSLASGLGSELNGMEANGFEHTTNNFGFNGTTVESGNTLMIDDNEKSHGTSSLKTQFSGTHRGARLNRNIESGDTLVVRAYFRINTSFDLNVTGQTFEWINLKKDYDNPGSPFLRFGFRTNVSGQISIWTRLDRPGPNNTVIYSGTAGEISREQWHQLEIRYYGNEALTGGVELYLDNILIAQRRDLDTTDPSVSGFNRLEIGGNTSGGARPIQDSIMWLDSLQLSRTNIGSFSTPLTQDDYIYSPVYSDPGQSFLESQLLTKVSQFQDLVTNSFWYDSSKQIIIFRLKPNFDPNLETLEFGRRQYAINLTNQSHWIINNLTIKRTDSTSSGGVFLSGSSNIKIIGINSSENLGSGVTVTEDSDNNLIQGCELLNNQRAFGGGVRVDKGSDSNLIKYNTITGPRGSGIYLRGEFTPSQNNELSYNHISQSYDAGIYLNTNVANTLISNNFIHDVVRSDVGGGNGVHLAIGTNGTTVSHNVIYNVESHGIQLRQEAHNNTIHNNTVFNAGTSGSGSGLYIQSGDGSFPYQNTLYNNIIHTAATSCITYDLDSSVTSQTRQDYNLCFNLNGTAFKFRDQLFTDLENYQAQSQYETHGAIANPDFYDLSGLDLRLNSESSAKKRGCPPPCSF